MGKSFHAGKAAMDGMLSALLSQKGFTAPGDILDGEPSFFEMFSGEYDPNEMIRGLGKDYQILTNSFKLYAACLLTHPAIDGLIWMRREFDFHSDSVEQIDLEVCPACLAVANNTHPKNALEGKFSIYFCAALAIEKGEVKESHFTQKLVDDDRIRGLMKKINVIRNESLGESEARIRVKLKNGTQCSHHVVAPKGDPRNPLSFEDIINKFEDLTCTVLSRRRMNRMIGAIQHLEKLHNLSELIRLCRADRDPLRRVTT
jgi:2-methylcitrate dehydratase PrpD